ncbi:MAG: transporter substrate-binding domain-containing protein [Lachnospiraceae bacterium]|nr:transporter substrate-binding domain-containing protein [Lachnospiraceae bacterium]
MKHRNIACGMIVLLVILIFTGGCGTKKETESQHQYTTLSELEDKRIGVATGSVQAIQTRERFPDADLFYYDTSTDMLTALRTGKIDAFAEADALVRYMMGENPDLICLEEYLKGGMQACAIFPKSEKGRALCDEFNDFLRQIKESGEYDEIKENTGEMYMKTVFEGTDFDPLRQGDPVCTSLIRNAARDISYTCAEGKGIVKGRLSRSIHI